MSDCNSCRDTKADLFDEMSEWLDLEFLALMSDAVASGEFYLGLGYKDKSLGRMVYAEATTLPFEDMAPLLEKSLNRYNTNGRDKEPRTYQPV